MIIFDTSGWQISGKLSDIIRDMKAGKIDQSLAMLCWQIVAYGTSYVNQLLSIGIAQKRINQALFLLK